MSSSYVLRSESPGMQRRDDDELWRAIIGARAPLRLQDRIAALINERLGRPRSSSAALLYLLRKNGLHPPSTPPSTAEDEALQTLTEAVTYLALTQVVFTPSRPWGWMDADKKLQHVRNSLHSKAAVVVSAGKLDRETTHWPWYVGEVVQPIWEHALDVVSGHKRDERIVVPPTVLCAQGGDEAIQQAMRSLGELAKILRTDSYERRELFLNSSKSVRSPQATDEARQEALRQFERERRRDEDNDARLCGIESLLAQAGSALLGAARSEKTPTERWICKRETDEILFAPWPSDNLGEIPLTGAVDPCDTTAFDLLRTLVATADACAVLHRDQRRIFERQLEILREHVSKQQPRRSKQVPLASSHPGMSSPSPVPARSCSTSPLSEACTPSPASSWHSSANWPRETPETSTELPPRGETTTPKPKGKAHDRSSV